MHILNQSEQPQSGIAIELVKFRILGRPYRKWRKLFTDNGTTDTEFLIGLKLLHEIEFDSLREDPMLFCTQDTQQMRLFREEGIESPNDLQIALTSKVWALSEDDCKAKMEALLQKMQEPEGVTS